MRWVQHWLISRDVLWSRKSMAYQLGSLLPDWFERHPIHRMDESFERIARRIRKINTMKSGFRRDFMIGTVAHFVEDYCCYAHSSVYYELIKHRIYEVRSQKAFKKDRKNDPGQYTALMNSIYEEYRNTCTKPEPDKFICIYTDELLRKVDELDAKEWHTDERVMHLDNVYAYAVLYGVLCMLGEPERSS